MQQRMMQRKRSRSEMSAREVLVGSSTRRVEGLIVRKEDYSFRSLGAPAQQSTIWRGLQDGAASDNSTDADELIILNTTEPLGNSPNSTTWVTTSTSALDELPNGRESEEENIYELETTFYGSNGNNGAMFDVSSPEGDHEIKIMALDVHTNLIQGDCPITVYGRPGTHVGFENSTVGWSLLVNTTVDCRGFGKRTVIPWSAFQESPILMGGETYAFYTMMPTPNIRYINGQDLGAIYSSNEFISIREGTGVADFFGGEDLSFVSPRVWNGVIIYELTNHQLANKTEFVEGCNSNLMTTYEDNLGSFGNMFDISTYSTAIEVHGFDFYTDLIEPVTYEIFTRPGSYVAGMYLEVTQRNDEGEGSEPGDGLTTNMTYTNVENMRSLNWTLVKRGTTIGKGFDQGTPVRKFVPFSVPPNSLQGFYITLTKADIRYRDYSVDIPDAKVGDTCFDNDDLAIKIGVSVGTYPGGGVYYGPRVWSGAIAYTADHTCPSEFPSAAPSTTPSIAPSSIVSNAPSLGVPDFGNCTDVSSLETTFEGGTGSYGNMFTVTSTEPVSVTSLDINAATTDTIYVEVYTRRGDYIGFSEDPASWRKVAATNVTGAGIGEPTLIPDEAFDDVHMGVNETRAFYITLATADIEYSRTNADVGEALVSDNFLAVNVGAGLAAPDFGGSLFEPRLFNGVVHYRRDDDCIDDITTVVMYNFNIQHEASMAEGEVVVSVNDNVQTTVAALVEIDSALKTYATEYDFELTNTTTQKTDTNDCIAAQEGGVCTALETRATFSHKSNLDQGKILFTMLQYRDTIGINLNLAQFDAQYDGDVPVQSGVVISLSGNFTAELSGAELKYFEAITRAYLNDQLSKIGVSILNVAVGSINERRYLQRNDDDEVLSSSSSIDISTVIDGSYRPPPEIDFSAVVEDAIDAEGGGYQDDLTNGRRDIPQEIIDEVGAFQTVTGVEAEVVTQQLPPTPAPTIADMEDGGSSSSTPIILAVVLSLLAVIFLLFLWYYRRSRKNKGGFFGKNDSPYLLDENAMEAQCGFDVSGGKYLQEQYPGLPTQDEQFFGGTVSTASSGFNGDFTFQPTDEAFAGGPEDRSTSSRQQQASVCSLPADMIASRYEKSTSGHSWMSAPMPHRSASGRFSPNSSGGGMVMGRPGSIASLSSGSRSPVPHAMMGRQQNIGNTGRPKGMASMGRSSASLGLPTMRRERSSASIGMASAGRRNPAQSHGQSTNPMMGRSMSSMGSAGLYSADSPEGQFEDENKQYATHSPTRNQHHTSGFSPVAPASRRFGEADVGIASSDTGGFHPTYHHRDERQGTPSPHGWQEPRPVYDERPQNLYDSRSNMSRPMMAGTRPRSPGGRPRSPLTPNG